MPASPGSVTDVVDRIENAGPLDPVAHAARRLVQAVIQPQALRDALHGVWLGHPVHPVLTDVPMGTWTAAAILDLVPGTGPAAATLIATGCLAAGPTALTGWVDFSELHEQQQRVGVVHAAANITALGCYVASLVARSQGRTLRGKVWSYAGFAAVSVGGYLGGHLAYRQALGVNDAEVTPPPVPAGMAAESVALGRPSRTGGSQQPHRSTASTCWWCGAANTSTSSGTPAHTWPRRCRRAASRWSQVKGASSAPGTSRCSDSPTARSCTARPRRRSRGSRPASWTAQWRSCFPAPDERIDAVDDVHHGLPADRRTDVVDQPRDQPAGRLVGGRSGVR